MVNNKLISSHSFVNANDAWPYYLCFLSPYDDIFIWICSLIFRHVLKHQNFQVMWSGNCNCHCFGRPFLSEQQELCKACQALKNISANFNKEFIKTILYSWIDLDRLFNFRKVSGRNLLSIIFSIIYIKRTLIFRFQYTSLTD